MKNKRSFAGKKRDVTLLTDHRHGDRLRKAGEIVSVSENQLDFLVKRGKVAAGAAPDAPPDPGKEKEIP